MSDPNNDRPAPPPPHAAVPPGASIPTDAAPADPGVTRDRQPGLMDRVRRWFKHD